MRVKICGITNLEDALAACEAGADALGFVFAEEAKKRNRYIEPEKAREIIEKLPPFVTTVAVCVNEPPEKLLAYSEICDRIQLCGDENAENTVYVESRVLIKVFRAGPDFDPVHAAAFPASAYLLDASVGDSHGGAGVTCDWEAARRAVDSGLPVILAGGLTPENVADAVRAVRPYAVDTSGGVESAPGKKDHEKIRRFIANARLPVP